MAPAVRLRGKDSRVVSTEAGRAVIRFSIPLRTVSAANSREFWAARAKRVKKERDAVRWAALATVARDEWLQPLTPCRVTLTRRGAKRLDDDNLRSALKGIRDEVAALIGIDDGDPSVEWTYDERPAGKDRLGRRIWSVDVVVEPTRDS